MRRLVLQHNGKPMACEVTAGPIRSMILDYPGDDADLWQVWEVPPVERYSVSENITERFALDWATAIIGERGFGDGIDPADYLAPFPAFVRHACGAKLVAMWQRRIAEDQAQEHQAMAEFGDEESRDGHSWAWDCAVAIAAAIRKGNHE